MDLPVARNKQLPHGWKNAALFLFFLFVKGARMFDLLNDKVDRNCPHNKDCRTCPHMFEWLHNDSCSEDSEPCPWYGNVHYFDVPTEEL